MLIAIHPIVFNIPHTTQDHQLVGMNRIWQRNLKKCLLWIDSKIFKAISREPGMVLTVNSQGDQVKLQCIFSKLIKSIGTSNFVNKKRVFHIPDLYYEEEDRQRQLAKVFCKLKELEEDKSINSSGGPTA